MMRTLLIRNATLVATMDDADTRVADGAVYVEDNVIAQVGPSAQLPVHADTIIDAREMIVLPGLVNTHHHFVQTLTRAVPGAQNADLFNWLRALYPIWAKLTPEAFYVSAQIAAAELLLSGCTTASDHTYIWPNGARLDDQIQAVGTIGLRFHASRGSMSVGESQGGLPPDRVVEDEVAILHDSRRLIEQYHDAERYAMLRIVLAPCSPFTVSADLMRESIALARSYGVHSHTHLAETRDEEDYCRQVFRRTPVELAEDLAWVGNDVWHAHMVHPHAVEVERLGRTRTGVAHCPSSNMRLASGVAPILALRAAGARVGLGVDGSASNDGSHLLGEARQALLLQRVGGDPAALSAYEALWLATRGGAEVLGRDDIGQLVPGMAADIIGIRLDSLGFAGGAVHDPLAALVFCQPANVDLSVINGRVRVYNGQFTDIDIAPIIARHNAIARALVRGCVRCVSKCSSSVHALRFTRHASCFKVTIEQQPHLLGD
ncbi:8-oxoguanine deaminase [Candidatus Gracilibacteria bacterium]|nr:8-oxoguanine deaminase [Candidatus Gracilibacteria bacterium]